MTKVLFSMRSQSVCSLATAYTPASTLLCDGNWRCGIAKCKHLKRCLPRKLLSSKCIHKCFHFGANEMSEAIILSNTFSSVSKVCVSREKWLENSSRNRSRDRIRSQAIPKMTNSWPSSGTTHKPQAINPSKEATIKPSMKMIICGWLWLNANIFPMSWCEHGTNANWNRYRLPSSSLITFIFDLYDAFVPVPISIYI